MKLSPPSLTSSTSSSPGTTSALPPQNPMTKTQRLHKLSDLRATMSQHLRLLLTQARHVGGRKREEIDAEVEEYRDLLDGIDILIRQLQKREREREGEGR